MKHIEKNRWVRPRAQLPPNLLGQDTPVYIAELQRYIRFIPDEEGRDRLVAIDGIYGEETRAAVADFQRQVGLPTTGRADWRTWELIFSEYEREMGLRQ